MIDGQSRLAVRPVAVEFLQTNFAVIAKGIAADERVVVSDLIPAVAGMLLDPVSDAEAARALVAEAEGRGPVR